MASPCGLEILGGRLGDILALAGSKKSVPALAAGVALLIDNAKTDILTEGFSKSPTAWTHAELWKAIQYVVRVQVFFKKIFVMNFLPL